MSLSKRRVARTWPLRRWLALRFALVAALPLATVALLTWLVLLPQLHADIENRHQMLARAVVGQVEIYLAGAQRQLSAVASLINRLGHRPAPYWFGLLDAHVGAGAMFEAIYLVDAAGLVHSVGLPESQHSRREDLIGLDLSQRDFLHQARARKEAVWSETFLSTVTGRLAVALAVPAADQAVVGEVTIAPLTDFINHLPERSEIIALILDHYGQVIAASRRSLSGQQLNFSHLPIIHDALRGQFTTRDVAFEGEGFIGTVVGIPQTGWTVLIAQPHHQAFQHITTNLWAMAVGVGIALLLALCAGWRLARDFSRRFDRYTDLACAVANGDYDRQWPISHIREFADLARDLQRMAQAIQQREQALVANETRFRDLSAMASDWFWEQDDQFRFTHLSTGSPTQTHLHFAVPLGITRWELHGIDLTPEQWATHRAILDAHQPFRSFEYRIQAPTGEEYWYSVHGKPLFDASGQFIGYRGTGRDITERKRSEALIARQINELYEREQLFRALFEQAGDANLLLDQDRFIDCNAVALQLIGAADKTQVIQHHPSELSPERQPDGQLSSEKAQFLMSTALRTGSQRVEWLHRRLDGGEVWVEVLLTAVPWQGQRVLHAIWRDLTERRRIEERQRLAMAVFETAQESIVVTDAEGHIVAVNPAFTVLSGYSEAEVLGQNPRFLKSGRHGDVYYAGLWQSIAKDGAWQGELWNRRKDGELYMVLATLSEVRDATGRLTHYINIATDITHQKEAEQRIEHLAYYDALTDLPNRALLSQRAELALALAARHHNGLAVLFMDLDRFKEVNDSLGHSEGDALLVQVAARLREQIRETDTVCRLGGDEFVLLLPDADQDGALQVADKVLMAFRQPFPLAGHHLRVTVSIGIALYPHDGQTVTELLKNADAALYQAKQDGRNTRAFYAREMNVATFERLMLETELRKAIAAGQLRAYYQAKVRLSDGRMIGAEALVRWQHPDHGLIPPGRFIPLAEASDLIVEIGDWMLTEVCRQLAIWRDAGLPTLTVAVNLAARHFRDAGLTARIEGLLAAHQLPPQALELELTESSLLEAGPQTAETLLAIKHLGVGLAIDDFGTGYSSLSYLKRLPLTALKIDQSFVRDLVTDTDDRILAATIVALGHSLGLKIVAEGVETDEQRRILLNQGCDLAQGYWFGRPIPAEEFGAALAASMA